MDFFLELIFDLIMDSSIEIAKDKTVKNWIKYPLVIFLLLFLITVLGVLLYLGIAFLFDPEISIKLGGVVILTIDLILIISAIKKLHKIKNKKEE